MTRQTSKKVEDQKPDDLDNQVDDESVTDDEEDGDDPEQSTTFKAITSQDQLDQIIQDRVRRAERSASKKLRSSIEKEIRDQLEAEASRREDEEKGNWKELYDSLKAENDQLKAEREKQSLADLKVSLLEDEGLPASAAKRILGTTEEEIKADIKEFLKDHPTVKKAPEEPGATSLGRKKPKGKKDENEKDYSSPSVWGLPSLSKK